MKNILLVALIAVALSCYSLPTQTPIQESIQNQSNPKCKQFSSVDPSSALSHTDYSNDYGAQCTPSKTSRLPTRIFDNILSLFNPAKNTPTPATLEEIKGMLSTNNRATQISEAVINKVLTTIKCADKYNIIHNQILTIIDYSLPSNEKRLWVFDLNKKVLLFNTYVSHGIKSGVLTSNFFSNKNNSKASSLGVYKTNAVYFGRHGLSLKLDGLERGFNDNASSRSVVMHGGWYVTENFIKKYGRAGRSWGCPAVPDELTSPIINTIKDNTLFVVYYPSDQWLLQSKFLRCDHILTPAIMANAQSNTVSTIASKEEKSKPNNTPSPFVTPVFSEKSLFGSENDQRDDILFADIHNRNRLADSEPVVAMSADSYSRIFNNKVPVDRMLRRQINNLEYIALSPTEIERLISSNELNAIAFVVPVIKMVRGYYETQMNLVPMGKVINITQSSKLPQTQRFTIHYENNTAVHLIPMHQFVRWVGL